MADRFVEFTVAVARMNKLIQKLKADGMKLFGLKAVDTLCLYQLFANGAEMNFSQIVQSCELDPALVSRTLKELVAGGMVIKSGEPGKYHAKYSLTPAAREKMTEISGIISQLQKQADAGITKEELENFYHCLSKLTANFEKMAEEPLAAFGRNEAGETTAVQKAEHCTGGI